MRSAFKRKWKIFALVFLLFVVFLLIHQERSFQQYQELIKTDVRTFTRLNGDENHVAFLMQPKNRCHPVSVHDKRFETVIIIMSRASHTVEREAIRETWGNPYMQMKYNFAIFFLVGFEQNVSLNTENSLNGDIIQADVREHYYNLTSKTIHAFKWFSSYCPEASFFIKTDDDVFVDLPKLHEIRKKYLYDNIILGNCQEKSSPIRYISKWQVSYTEYPFKMYPTFCRGPGYVMTSNTAREISTEMLNTIPFKLEDVFVGIVAYKLGISTQNIEFIIDMQSMTLWHIFLTSFDIYCATIVHYASPEEIRRLWRVEKSRSPENCSYGTVFKYLFT